jgi:putative transport protein
LALCVYAIGIQVGPGFFSSLRQDGLRINIVAGIVALFGVAITVVAGILLKVDPEILAGIYAGALTNTPSLAAVQTTLARLQDTQTVNITAPGTGYAVAYPVAITGSVLAILLARMHKGWNQPPSEGTSTSIPQLRISANILIENPEFDGITVGQLLEDTKGRGLVITRRGRQGQVAYATHDMDLRTGDTILVVGKARHVDWLRDRLGRRSDVDLRRIPSDVGVAQIAVTKHPFLNRDVLEAQTEYLEGVTITRVRRGEVELAPKPGVKLLFGDIIQLVGAKHDVEQAIKRIGDPPREIEKPKVGTLLLGLLLGMIIGSIEIQIPGLAAPLRLGLAGGPLLVALILGRVGRLGPLTFQMRPSACDTLRELGLAVFIASVGLRAGENFVASVTGAHGLSWMLCAAIITMSPLLLCAVLARFALRMDVNSFAGLSAGTMTNPTGLAFAARIAGDQSSRVYIAYATVYPLVMIIRVISAQLLVMFLAGKPG